MNGKRPAWLLNISRLHHLSSLFQAHSFRVLIILLKLILLWHIHSGIQAFLLLKLVMRCKHILSLHRSLKHVLLRKFSLIHLNCHQSFLIYWFFKLKSVALMRFCSLSFILELILLLNVYQRWSLSEIRQLCHHWFWSFMLSSRLREYESLLCLLFCIHNTKFYCNLWNQF